MRLRAFLLALFALGALLAAPGRAFFLEWLHPQADAVGRGSPAAAIVKAFLVSGPPRNSRRWSKSNA